MNKITFQDIYDQFLTYTSSCTLAGLPQEELEYQMSLYLKRALGDFIFPLVSLDYAQEELVDPETQEVKYVYTFTDKLFDQREVNVILSLMKKYYIETLLSRERNFQTLYYDSDTRTHSQSAILQQMNALYKQVSKEASDAQYNYSRVDKHRKPRIGHVNA